MSSGGIRTSIGLAKARLIKYTSSANGALNDHETQCNKAATDFPDDASKIADVNSKFHRRFITYKENVNRTINQLNVLHGDWQKIIDKKGTAEETIYQENITKPDGFLHAIDDAQSTLNKLDQRLRETNWDSSDNPSHPPFSPDINGTSSQQQTVVSMPDIEVYEASEDGQNFPPWLTRFEFGVAVSASHLSDIEKVKFLMTRLSSKAFKEYSHSCLPGEIVDYNFRTTCQRLKKLFSGDRSIFIDRYECLKINREDGEEFKAFVNRLKHQLHKFEFEKLNEEQFNCLVLLTSLKAQKDSRLRERILHKLHKDGDDVEFDAVISECEQYLSTIAEAKTIEKSPKQQVNNVQLKKSYDKKGSPRPSGGTSSGGKPKDSGPPEC